MSQETELSNSSQNSQNLQLSSDKEDDECVPTREKPKFTILDDMKELETNMNVESSEGESPISLYLNALRKSDEPKQRSGEQSRSGVQPVQPSLTSAQSPVQKLAQVSTQPSTQPSLQTSTQLSVQIPVHTTAVFAHHNKQNNSKCHNVQTMKNIIYEKLNTFHNLKNKTGHSNDCDRFATSLSRKLRENEGTRPGIYLHRKVIDLTKDLQSHQLERIDMTDNYFFRTRKSIVAEPATGGFDLFSKAIGKKNGKQIK